MRKLTDSARSSNLAADRVRSLLGRGFRRAFRLLAWCVVALLLPLLVVEAGFRWLERRGKIGVARAARLEEAYQASAFREDGLGAGGYLAPGFSGFVKNEYGKPVEWVHNSLGFRTREEISRQRPPGVLRILMLGDSFVAGHRLGQEQTVGYRVESWLRRNGYPGCEVLIAAIEEPTTGLEYLETIGVQFEPQVVFLGITLGNDLAQVYSQLEGKHRRYDLTGEPGDGARQLVENPDWDRKARWRYLKSLRIPASALLGPGKDPDARTSNPKRGNTSWPEFHSLRMIRDAWAERRARNEPQAVRSYWRSYREPKLIDGNGIGMHLNPAPPEIERTYELLFDLLEAYQRVCKRHGIRFVVAIHGQRYQVQPRDLEATLETYSLRRSHFDLMQPNRRIAEFCMRKGIPCLDPTEEMAAVHERTGDQMFMPRGDMHWNALGAEAFFDGIKDELGRVLADVGVGQ
jgi:hypothetical protein